MTAMLGPIYSLPLKVLGALVVIVFLTEVLALEGAWLLFYSPADDLPYPGSWVSWRGSGHPESRHHEFTVDPGSTSWISWSCGSPYGDDPRPSPYLKDRPEPEAGGACGLGSGTVMATNQSGTAAGFAVESQRFGYSDDWVHFVVTAPPHWRVRVVSATHLECVTVSVAPHELGCRQTRPNSRIDFTLTATSLVAFVPGGSATLVALMNGLIVTMIVGGLLLIRRLRAK